MFPLTLKNAQHHLLPNMSVTIQVQLDVLNNLFFLLLQSIAARFMGPKAYVEVHKGWSEPIILWKLTMAKKNCLHLDPCIRNGPK